MPGLGRVHAPDERDRRFMMQPPASEAAKVEQRLWYLPEILDQGDQPECVGFSWYHYLTASPVRNQPVFTPRHLYKLAQAEDEWPGDDYPGSSVRGGAKALQKKGLLSEYNWAFSADAVIDHLLTKGPVVVGTNWYAGMNQCDKRGFLHLAGHIVGGHAYCLIGASRPRGAVRVAQTWGYQYYQRGRAWLTFDHLNHLIQADGEACVAAEVKG